MKPIKILYFDDEKWLSETLQKNLQDTYPLYQINLVETIESFLDELESSKKYDLIMIDIMAPMSLILDNEKIRTQFSHAEIQAMNDGSNVGEILYQKVRKKNDYTSTPILFYSAKRMTIVKGDNTAFIRRPEFAEVIHEKIQLLLKKL